MKGDPKSAPDAPDDGAEPAEPGLAGLLLSPCEHVRPYFSDELDGETLPAKVGFFLRMHLTICPPCRRVHRSLVSTREALRALRDLDPDDEKGGGP